MKKMIRRSLAALLALTLPALFILEAAADDGSQIWARVQDNKVLAYVQGDIQAENLQA